MIVIFFYFVLFFKETGKSFFRVTVHFCTPVSHYPQYHCVTVFFASLLVFSDIMFSVFIALGLPHCFWWLETVGMCSLTALQPGILKAVSSEAYSSLPLLTSHGYWKSLVLLAYPSLYLRFTLPPVISLT